MDTFKYNLLDFQIFMNLESLQKKQLFIWGAASKGKQIQKTLNHIGIHTVAFCDSDVNKWETSCNGLPVISPYMLKKIYIKDSQICIISCISREKELLKALHELSFNNISLISYWGIKTACILHGIPLEVQDNLPTYDIVWANEKKILSKEYVDLSYLLNRTQIYNPNIVWILQPGKVASSTIKKRLQQAGVSFIHLHNLMLYPSHIWNNDVKKLLKTRLQVYFEQGTKIITGVREPLSRDYSAFWQPFTDDWPYIMPILNMDFQKMYESYIKLILNGFNHTKNVLQESLSYVWNEEFEWFNREIKKNCGIDIYQYAFDKEKGYQIIRQGNIQIFIYKTEKLNGLMPILNEFLGTTISSQENINLTENKSYYLAYKDFRKRIKLPYSYVKHYYKDNLYMKHFYTEWEQEYYLSQWKHNIQDDK